MSDKSESKPRIAHVHSNVFYLPEWQTVDKDGYYDLVHVIEYSAYESLQSTLRCMQQIIKANGNMTYEQFLTNLEACGLSEEDL